MFFRFILFFFVAGTFVAPLYGAPIRLVVSKESRQNPTLSFSGIAGAPELSGELTTFLKVCGWFDLVTSGEGDYKLSGRSSGGRLYLELTSGGAPAGTWVIQENASPRSVAKSAVDAIIEKTFKDLRVRGFCKSRIAFCAQTSPGVRNIYLCDIDGRGIEQLTHYKTLCVEPCWNPNGHSVGYSKYGRTGIEVIETTLTRPRQSRILSAYSGINAGAALSPDQRSLALILSPDHMVDLYVMDRTTRRLRRLTKGLSVEASPCWSADGKQLVFVSDDTGAPRLNIINLAANTRKRLPTVGSDAVTPDWSSDGKIVYATRVDGFYTIAVYDPESNENRRVVELGGEWESPAWAADNRQVVCKRTSGGKSELYVIDTWTGKTRVLVSPGMAVSMPAWSRGEPR